MAHALKKAAARPGAATFWRSIFAGTGLLFSAQLGRLLLHAVGLLIMARGLGASDLGAVAVLLAVANMLRPLAGLGYHVLVVQEVARDRTRMAAMLGLALPAHLLGGLALGLLAIVLIVPQLGLGLPAAVVVAMLLSELVLGGLYAFLSNSWQAEQRFAAQAGWLVLLPAVNILALLALLLAHRLSLATYVAAQVGSLLVVVVAGYALRLRSGGGLRLGSPREFLRGARMGLAFAIGLVGLGILPEIDKLFLPRLAGLTAAGQYAVGTKLVNVAILPLGSLLGTFLPRFFRHGREGALPALGLAGRAWRVAVPYACVAGLAMVAAAPLALPLFGAGDYPDVPRIIRWGAGLLLLQALHMPAGDALSGCGHARYRAIAQTGVAVGAGALAILAIPRWGWGGALLAAYVGHAALVLLLGLRLLALARPRSA